MTLGLAVDKSAITKPLSDFATQPTIDSTGVGDLISSSAFQVFGLHYRSAQKSVRIVEVKLSLIVVVIHCSETQNNQTSYLSFFHKNQDLKETT
jgi:hypothetical protein